MDADPKVDEAAWLVVDEAEALLAALDAPLKEPAEWVLAKGEERDPMLATRELVSVKPVRDAVAAMRAAIDQVPDPVTPQEGNGHGEPVPPVRVKAEPVRAVDLKPGDLFSTAGPAYWEQAIVGGSIGERVYVRTQTPAEHAEDEPGTIVYRITLER